MQSKAIRRNMARTAGAVVLREDVVAQCGALESKQGEEGNHTVGQPAIGKSEAEQSEKGVQGGQPGKGSQSPAGSGGYLDTENVGTGIGKCVRTRV